MVNIFCSDNWNWILFRSDNWNWILFCSDNWNWILSHQSKPLFDCSFHLIDVKVSPISELLEFVRIRIKKFWPQKYMHWCPWLAIQIVMWAGLIHGKPSENKIRAGSGLGHFKFNREIHWPSSKPFCFKF